MMAIVRAKVGFKQLTVYAILYNSKYNLNLGCDGIALLSF